VDEHDVVAAIQWLTSTGTLDHLVSIHIAPAVAEAIKESTIAAVRRETIEECAKVCDDMSGWRDWAALKHPNFTGAPCEAGAAADYLAAAIRAMQEVPRG
jgi:hypothetical protein